MNNKKTVIFRLLTVLFLFGVFLSIPFLANSQTSEKEDGHYIYAFGQLVKEVKEEDYNIVRPDYSKINPNDYKTTSEYQSALARESYKAHEKQIEQDMKYYMTNNTGKPTTELPQNNNNKAYLEEETKQDNFKWDRYEMMKHFEKPIYSYGKESAVKSTIRDTSNFYSKDAQAVVVLIIIFIVLGILVVVLKSCGAVNDVSGTEIAINKIKSLGNNAVEKVKSGVETGVAKGVDLADKTTQKVANKVAKVITEAKQNASESQEKKELESKVKDLELEVLRKKVKELEDQLREEK